MGGIITIQVLSAEYLEPIDSHTPHAQIVKYIAIKERSKQNRRLP